MIDVIELLQKKAILSDTQIKEVQSFVDSGDTSESALIKVGVAPGTILATLGEYYNMPVRELQEHEKIDPTILKYISEDSARHYKLLPLSQKDGVLEVGITDPDEIAAIDALNFIAAKEKISYQLTLILTRDLKRGVEMYENLSGEVDEALTELEGQLADEIKSKENEKNEKQKNGDGSEHIKEDAPVTKIVATVLRYAVDGSASDIHIEPLENKVRVRFRIDGVLTTSLELPKKIHSAAVARIKILSSMRLDEKRKPQDGRFSANIDSRKVDFRVSTLPTYYGEKVVMRILDPESGVRTLDSTGISEHNLALIREAVRQPYGIILISGPTGSGKSTTLYGLLSEVDRLGKNVISLEDPVEFNIDGVSQSQVKPEIGFTFASGLRSVLRQDPDIIMVGEIRDKETAQLAIQAALTGHLVLSTIHTNNAIGVAPRLIDMGVDPYLIAPTLLLAVAQRLVRRICPGSGEEMSVEGSIKMMVDNEFASLPKEYHARIPQSDTVLKTKPTADCPNGTRGRVAATEVLEVTESIERCILDSASEDDIYDVARKQGFMSMKEDAIVKAFNHEIPFEEVNTLGGALIVSDEAEAEKREFQEEPQPVDKTDMSPELNSV